MIRLRAAERLEVEHVAELTGLNASELFRRAFQLAQPTIVDTMRRISAADRQARMG